MDSRTLVHIATETESKWTANRDVQRREGLQREMKSSKMYTQQMPDAHTFCIRI